MSAGTPSRWVTNGAGMNPMDSMIPITTPLPPWVRQQLLRITLSRLQISRTSRRTRRLQHAISYMTSQAPSEVLDDLIKRGFRKAWLMGGGKLAASFHARGLISQYIISVFPVLLGSGIPFLAPHSCAQDTLSLVTAKPFKSGIVQLTYRRAEKTSAARSEQRHPRKEKN